MDLNQMVELQYCDATVILPKPVKKQIWDGKQFVSTMLYRITGTPGHDALQWLTVTFGGSGTYQQGKYWDYSKSGNFTVMDEKVYTWYQIKWGNK